MSEEDVRRVVDLVTARPFGPGNPEYDADLQVLHDQSGGFVPHRSRRSGGGEPPDPPPGAAPPTWFDDMNRDYALVKLGSDVAVIDFTRNVQGQPAFLTLDAFHAWHQNRTVRVGEGEDSKPKYAPASRVW